jgi:hypothetical protein
MTFHYHHTLQKSHGMSKTLLFMKNCKYFLLHGQVTRSQITGWSPKQRLYLKKNPGYFHTTSRLPNHRLWVGRSNKDHMWKTRDIFHTTNRLPDHEWRAGRPNGDHLWKILDIFHTISKLPDYEPRVGRPNRDNSWKILDIFHIRADYLITNHWLVTQSETIHEKSCIVFTYRQVARTETIREES